MSNAGAPRRHFASDNYAGICPEAFAALTEANQGHEVGYGEDSWTAKAADLIREVFETNCEVFFVFNGTSANSLSLAALCQSYHSILCHERAHIEEHECGAPEFFTHGAKLCRLPGDNGKLVPATIAEAAQEGRGFHSSKPGALSLTQTTEWGTLYTPAELRALTETAHRLNLRVQMDGARFANAVAALGVAPKAITWQAGVDVLSFGGTKNGLAVGEALVFFDTALARDFEYRCKQAGQIASKMRFLSAPWVGMLRDGAWLRHAAHANAMARRLEHALQKLPGVQLACPVETNAVFALLPEPVVQGMYRRGWKFYTMGGARNESRLMCSWDTTAADVDTFAADLKAELAAT